MKSLSDGFFSIDSKNGFLPTKEPLRNLPSRYETLQQLIDEMPVLKQDGNPGILANHGSIEEAIKILPNYLDLVKLKKILLLMQLFLERILFWRQHTLCHHLITNF